MKAHFHSADNPIAYCKLHHLGLSPKMMKHKDCLGKGCWYLRKNESHPFWQQREERKELRKQRKETLRRMVDGF